MKRMITILLCLAFAVGTAEAKTYYVDATRPNNNGNGLKAATAKKTIQAAINIAQDGDTIVVYPGTYAPIRTNNKKITVKSSGGAWRTTIKRGEYLATMYDFVANLAAWKETGGNRKENLLPWLKTIRNGHATKLTGFSVTAYECLNFPGGAVAGGTVSHCLFSHLGWGDLESGGSMIPTAYTRTSTKKTVVTYAIPTVYQAYLADCTMMSCDQSCSGIDSASFLGICQSRLIRCRIRGCNQFEYPFRIHDSDFRNCLIAETPRIAADNTSFVNCTIVRAGAFRPTKSRFKNCILFKSGTGAFQKANRNQFARTYQDGRSPKFLSYAEGEYHLSSTSSCVDKGNVFPETGSKDLSGNRRVQGKAVDMGCYEYSANQKMEVLFFTGSDYFDGLGCGYQYGMIENNRTYGLAPWRMETYARSGCYGALPVPQKKNCLFAGWWTDPTTGRQVSDSTRVAADSTLFAHWMVLDNPYWVLPAGLKGENCLYVTPMESHVVQTDDFQYQTVGQFNLVIPEKFNGKTITHFMYSNLPAETKSLITGATIPKSFTKLDDAFFNGWNHLASVTIPKSVATIGYQEFATCTSLKTIRLQNGSPLVPGVDFLVPDGCQVVRY